MEWMESDNSADSAQNMDNPTTNAMLVQWLIKE